MYKLPCACVHVHIYMYIHMAKCTCVCMYLHVRTRCKTCMCVLYMCVCIHIEKPNRGNESHAELGKAAYTCVQKVTHALLKVMYVCIYIHTLCVWGGITYTCVRLRMYGYACVCLSVCHVQEAGLQSHRHVLCVCICMYVYHMYVCICMYGA